jgi:hypothetical protein
MLRFVSGPVATRVDLDVFSFTVGTDDGVLAATLAAFGRIPADMVLDVIVSDGTTVLETGDEEGAVESVSNAGDSIVAVVDLEPERAASQWSVIEGIGELSGSFIINCNGSARQRGCELTVKSNTGETLWSAK